jgi:hypothetical protein
MDDPDTALFTDEYSDRDECCDNSNEYLQRGHLSSDNESSCWEENSKASTFSQLNSEDEEEEVETFVDFIGESKSDDDSDADSECEMDSSDKYFQDISDCPPPTRKWKKNESCRGEELLCDKTLMGLLFQYECKPCRMSKACLNHSNCRNVFGLISDAKELLAKFRLSYWPKNGNVTDRKKKLLGELTGFLNFDLLKQTQIIDFKICGRSVCKSFFKVHSCNNNIIN